MTLGDDGKPFVVEYSEAGLDTAAPDEIRAKVKEVMIERNKLQLEMRELKERVRELERDLLSSETGRVGDNYENTKYWSWITGALLLVGLFCLYHQTYEALQQAVNACLLVGGVGFVISIRKLLF